MKVDKAVQILGSACWNHTVTFNAEFWAALKEALRAMRYVILRNVDLDESEETEGKANLGVEEVGSNSEEAQETVATRLSEEVPE